MDIQRLTPQEWERFRRIRLASLKDSPGAFGSTLGEVKDLREADWRKQLEEISTFVAVHEGTDIGVVRGALARTDPSMALLLSMWVAPLCRRRRVGGQLIQAVVEWARSAGLSRLVLDVADDNLAAVALYSREGFESTGEVGTLPPPRSHIREHRRALLL